MNKKKITATCLTALLLFCLNWIIVKKNPIENDLALLNIEALAENEIGGNVICMGVGSLDCPIPHAKVALIRIF